MLIHTRFILQEIRTGKLIASFHKDYEPIYAENICGAFILPDAPDCTINSIAGFYDKYRLLRVDLLELSVHCDRDLSFPKIGELVYEFEGHGVFRIYSYIDQKGTGRRIALGFKEFGANEISDSEQERYSKYRVYMI